MSIDVAAGQGASGRTGLILRWVARGILLAIAAFWLWFGIADGLGDALGANGEPLGLMGFIMMLPAALICFAVLYVAWRWEFAGGLVLLALTLLGAFFFFQNMRRISPHGSGPGFLDGLIGLAIFVLPFLVPALLLLFKCGMDRATRLKARLTPN